MTEPFSGIIPVLATPFNGSGEIDLPDFESLIEFAIAAGAHALAMFGLASEYYKLTDSERVLLQAALIRTVRQRVPVIVSITQHATEIAVRQAMDAEAQGADALMLLPPFFLNPDALAIRNHVAEIVSSVRIPTVLQYAPAQTGLTAEIVAQLPVSAVKVDTVPSADVLSSLSNFESRLVGYMGLDLPEAFAAGCSGCMPTASLTRPFVDLWQSLAQPGAAGAQEHRRMLPLLQFMMQSVEFLIAAEKQLLFCQGVIRNPYCRRPAASVSPLDIQKLRDYYSAL